MLEVRLLLLRGIRTWGRGRGLEVLGYVFDIETRMAEEVVIDRERVIFEIKESLEPVSEKPMGQVASWRMTKAS